MVTIRMSVTMPDGTRLPDRVTVGPVLTNRWRMAFISIAASGYVVTVGVLVALVTLPIISLPPPGTRLSWWCVSLILFTVPLAVALFGMSFARQLKNTAWKLCEFYPGEPPDE